MKKKDQDSAPSSDSELLKLAEEAKQEEREEGAPGPEPTPSQGPAPSGLDPDTLGLIWKTLFGVAARSRGDHWALTEQESHHLGTVSVAVVDKYVPAMLSKYGAEVALAVAVVGISLPRLKEDGIARQRRDSGHTGPAGGGQVHPPGEPFKEKDV